MRSGWGFGLCLIICSLRDSPSSIKPCALPPGQTNKTESEREHQPISWLWDSARCSSVECSPSAFFLRFPFSCAQSLSRSLLALFYVCWGEPAHLWMRQNRRNEWLEEKVAGGITEDLRHFIAWITLRMRLLQEEGKSAGFTVLNYNI